jgi:hypothetical protein
MNTEYVYTLAERFRVEARALYAMKDVVLHDANLSVQCRERLAAGFETQAGLAYDQATEVENEIRRMWRGEAGMEDAA